MLSTMVAGLPRVDQRRWATAYVDVLCQLEGAPPARTLVSWIAQQLGVSDRSLQQFLNRSTWDPAPICEQTAMLAHEVITPQAWVVRDVCFSRHGQQMAGVARQFVPEFNRVVNCQQSLAVFAATAQEALPLCWHLRLPQEWSGDEERRARARIPQDVEAHSRVEDVMLVLARAEASGASPEGPVVLDGGPARASTTLIRELLDNEFPFLVRVEPRLAVVTGGGTTTAPLGEVAERERANLEPATWRDPEGVLRRSKLRVLDVGLPLWPGRAATPLRALVDWPLGRSGPAALWITDLTDGPDALLELTRTMPAVDHAMAELTGRFALDAFEGRTYHGWHHHVALSSCAYVLSRWERSQAEARVGASPALSGGTQTGTAPDALAAHLTHLTQWPTRRPQASTRRGLVTDRGRS